VARKAQKKIEKIHQQDKKKEAAALMAFPIKRIIREAKTKKEGVQKKKLSKFILKFL